MSSLEGFYHWLPRKNETLPNNLYVNMIFVQTSNINLSDSITRYSNFKNLITIINLLLLNISGMVRPVFYRLMQAAFRRCFGRFSGGAELSANIHLSDSFATMTIAE
jgi:hypothetical protein